jgi:hypothetical protein
VSLKGPTPGSSILASLYLSLPDLPTYLLTYLPISFLLNLCTSLLKLQYSSIRRRSES